MSMAEEIQALNKFADKHASNFRRSVYGRFTPQQVQADIAELCRQGFEIRKKIDMDLFKKELSK